MAKQIITDEESKLKRQARRRLLGAISLTILVVVLLPMLLDNEPPTPTQDIDLKIPDKDKVGEFVPKMVLPPLNDNASQPVSAPVIAPLMDSRPNNGLTSAQSEVKPTHEVKLTSKPVVENKPEINPPKVEKPVPKTESVAKPVSESENKPSAKLHSGFVVQVGAFSKAKTANKLQQKLLKQGYPSYTEQSGDKIRVRVGDYSSQAEAEKIRRKLEIQGMQPDVVKIK